MRFASKKLKFQLSWPTDDDKCRPPLRYSSNSVCSMDLASIIQFSISYSFEEQGISDGSERFQIDQGVTQTHLESM